MVRGLSRSTVRRRGPSCSARWAVPRWSSVAARRRRSLEMELGHRCLSDLRSMPGRQRARSLGRGAARGKPRDRGVRHGWGRARRRPDALAHVVEAMGRRDGCTRQCELANTLVTRANHRQVTFAARAGLPYVLSMRGERAGPLKRQRRECSQSLLAASAVRCWRSRVLLAQTQTQSQSAPPAV